MMNAFTGTYEAQLRNYTLFLPEKFIKPLGNQPRINLEREVVDGEILPYLALRPEIILGDIERGIYLRKECTDHLDIEEDADLVAVGVNGRVEILTPTSWVKIIVVANRDFIKNSEAIFA